MGDSPPWDYPNVTFPTGLTPSAVRVPNVPGRRGQASVGQAKELAGSRLTRQLPGRFRPGFGFSTGTSELGPMPSANTDNTLASAIPGTKDKRFSSAEGELGEESQGAGWVIPKRRGFLKLPGRPPLRTKGIRTYFYVCSNITKDRHPSSSCPVCPRNRNSSWK